MLAKVSEMRAISKFSMIMFVARAHNTKRIHAVTFCPDSLKVSVLVSPMLRRKVYTKASA
jgi:hypothetical protein